MIPPQESLDTGDLQARQVEDRLIRHEELLAERCSQVQLELEAVQHFGLHVRLEHDGAGLPRSLRSIQRDVGVAQQVLRGEALTRGDADAGQGRQRQALEAGQLERLQQDVEQPRRNELRSAIE